MPSILSPKILVVAGRVGLASLFLLGGLNKIINYGDTIIGMETVGLQPAGILLPLVIMLEIGGGALVASGRWPAAWAALALAAFTFGANLAFHDFWTMEGERAALELSLFFKNLSIMGGLIFVAGILFGQPDLERDAQRDAQRDTER